MRTTMKSPLWKMCTCAQWPRVALLSLLLFTEQQSGAKNINLQGYFLNFKKNPLGPPCSAVTEANIHVRQKKAQRDPSFDLQLRGNHWKTSHDCCSWFVRPAIIHDKRVVCRSTQAHAVHSGRACVICELVLPTVHQRFVPRKRHSAGFWISARGDVTEGAVVSAPPLHDHLVPNMWQSIVLNRK